MPGSLNTGTGAAAVRYRILYDTLSRLICNMNKCDSIQELNFCLCNNVKYLFDYVAIKFSVRGTMVGYSMFVPRNRHVEEQFTPAFSATLQPYEQQAAETQIVQYYATAAGVATLGTAPDDRLAAAWVFPFHMKESSLVVTIFCGPGLEFYKSDIPILKILCEAYLARLLSLNMLEEVLRSRQTLEQAYESLDLKTKQIEHLNDVQEHVIAERTAELQHKNRKLEELVRFNAHQIREPLTRILGLLQVMDLTGNWQPGELTEALKTSGSDLDKAVRNVITYIEHD